MAVREFVSDPPDPAMAGNECQRVAVLIPAYNPGDAINDAVASIVANTYPSDIYVVDDGSEIPVADILESFPRVTVIRLDKNVGVARALNVGLEIILARTYEFVARMDADDVCYPDRIASEVEFLEGHPEIAAVGAWVRHIDGVTGRPLFIQRTPASPEAVKKALNYNAAIVHITFMVRADVLRRVGPYSEDYPVAEDYELFRRIVQEYPIANIPRVLVDRNLSPKGVSLTRRRSQLMDRLRIQLLYFDPLEPAAWSGVLKTLLLFLVPSPLLVKIKAHRSQA